MRPDVSPDLLVQLDRGVYSWIPYPDHYNISLGYGELRIQYLKLMRQLEGAETAGEYKDIKYEDARDQMCDFLVQHKLVANAQFGFFMKEMAKSNAQLAHDYIVNKSMSLINDLSPRLYKDAGIIGILLKYPHVGNYIKEDTPEKIAFKRDMERIKDKANLRQLHKGYNYQDKKIGSHHDIGNIGSKKWEYIESFLGGKNKSKRYAKNTQSRRRKISRSRKNI
jgi:hypothetical protein